MGPRFSIKQKIGEILREATVEAMRSQGAGGQHVNKTASAIRLRWSLAESYVLVEEEKNYLREKLRNQLTTAEEILIRSESERDQLTNRKECYEKFERLLLKCLVVPKFRVATKPTRSSQRKRLNEKKLHGEKKQLRGKIKD